MGISSSLYASISGLNTMGNAMSVLGDNVANVNTIAFKSSRATFQDVLSQSIATAAGAAQVGRGVTLSTVDGLFAQGSFESTSTSTDLAIGGQGFFMLRASDSAQADMYTRAGEFRFDQQGYLVNPVGHYVQGWTIDSTSGEVTGTIGDINLGKSTPPVASTKIEVIVNVDSRKQNEVTETRLFDAWDGTNSSGANPTDPIDTSNFSYTTAIKVYDSKGASHDITTYFARTTQDNQWEFLVTCEPSEDLRILTGNELITYAPDERYNYEVHKGSGALMYGVLNFNTSGDITNVYAWNVPPDGKVDPWLNDNRIFLNPTDNYYSFEANFTGAATNQEIALNLGAQYNGSPDLQRQVLVSNRGAYSDQNSTNPITKETLMTSVYDASGNQISVGDRFVFSGYDHDGNYKTGSYTVGASDKVQALLTQVDNTFGATSTIDSLGRLRVTDDSGGESGMFINSFTTYSVNQADPFGGGTAVTGNIARTLGRLVSSDGATAITTATTALTSVYETIALGTDKVDNGDVFTFAGNDVGGNLAALTFTVGTSGTTVQSLLTALENTYSVNAGDVTAVLDASGYIRLIDNTNSGQMTPSLTSYTHPLANPLGADGAIFVTVAGAAGSSAVLRDSAGNPLASAATALVDVFDGAGSRLAPGDLFTFAGVAADGTAIGAGNTFTVTTTNTVADLVTYLAGLYEDGVAGGGTGVNATVVFNVGTGAIDFTDLAGVELNVVLTSTTQTGNIATPLGATGALTLSSSITGQINISTSKREVVSLGQALTTASGVPPVITANTAWTSVFDSNGNQVGNGDIVFTGTTGDNTPVSLTYTIDTTGTSTVQDLLNQIETTFDVDAIIDGAGRLMIRDRVADSSIYSSQLSIAISSFPPDNGVGTAYLFGLNSASAFQTITGAQTEDGSQMGDSVSVSFEPEALASTQYANSSTTIFQDQDGFAAGFLQSVAVDTDGIITGNYSNGQVLKKAQVALASFNNLAGLSKEGGNVFRETTESGAPVTGAPGTNGLGSIAPNSLEQSNVDLGTEFVKLITTQRGFQANSKIITTTDEMLADLINIKR